MRATYDSKVQLLGFPESSKAQWHCWNGTGHDKDRIDDQFHLFCDSSAGRHPRVVCHADAPAAWQCSGMIRSENLHVTFPCVRYAFVCSRLDICCIAAVS